MIGAQLLGCGRCYLACVRISPARQWFGIEIKAELHFCPLTKIQLTIGIRPGQAGKSFVTPFNPCESLTGMVALGDIEDMKLPFDSLLNETSGQRQHINVLNLGLSGEVRGCAFAHLELSKVSKWDGHLGGLRASLSKRVRTNGFQIHEPSLRDGSLHARFWVNAKPLRNSLRSNFAKSRNLRWSAKVADDFFRVHRSQLKHAFMLKTRLLSTGLCKLAL